MKILEKSILFFKQLIVLCIVSNFANFKDDITSFKRKKNKNLKVDTTQHKNRLLCTIQNSEKIRKWNEFDQLFPVKFHFF